MDASAEGPCLQVLTAAEVISMSEIARPMHWDEVLPGSYKRREEQQRVQLCRCWAVQSRGGGDEAMCVQLGPAPGATG
jgi:hypothetical protein